MGLMKLISFKMMQALLKGYVLIFHVKHISEILNLSQTNFFCDLFHFLRHQQSSDEEQIFPNLKLSQTSRVYQFVTVYLNFFFSIFQWKKKEQYTKLNRERK